MAERAARDPFKVYSTGPDRFEGIRVMMLKPERHGTRVKTHYAIEEGIDSVRSLRTAAYLIERPVDDESVYNYRCRLAPAQ